MRTILQFSFTKKTILTQNVDLVCDTQVGSAQDIIVSSTFQPSQNYVCKVSSQSLGAQYKHYGLFHLSARPW